MSPASAGHQIDNRYRRAFQGSYEGAVQHWRLFVAVVVVGVTLLSGYEFVAGETGWVRMKQIEAETRQMATDNQTLARQVQDLKEQERLLSSDDFVLEKIVRENLRLSRPGEILYIFEETASNSASTDPVQITVAKRPPKKVEEEKGAR